MIFWKVLGYKYYCGKLVGPNVNLRKCWGLKYNFGKN